MRPPLPYFGGKQRIAHHIVDVFPEHLHYIEPYAGGLSVLLAKPASKMETINDLDGDLITFWRVLRDNPEELIRVCAFTPHSRAELRRACDGEAVSDLERARRVWVELTQGRSGMRGRHDAPGDHCASRCGWPVGAGRCRGGGAGAGCDQRAGRPDRTRRTGPDMDRPIHQPRHILAGRYLVSTGIAEYEAAVIITRCADCEDTQGDSMSDQEDER